MVVVPRLAERRDRQPEDVGRVVVDVEAPLADEVADAVDRPRDVVQEEDAHEAGPQEHLATRRPACRSRRSRRARRDQRASRATSQPNMRLIRRMPRSSSRSGAYRARRARPCSVNSQPTWACHRPLQAGAVADVRAVRVALLVGVGVVLAVVGDPVDDAALDGHRAEDGERVLDRLGGLERAVGEHPVEADRDAEAAQRCRGRRRRSRSAAWTPRPHSEMIATITPTNGMITAARLALRWARVMDRRFSRIRPWFLTDAPHVWLARYCRFPTNARRCAAAGPARLCPTRSSRRSPTRCPSTARPMDGAFGRAVRIGVERALARFIEDDDRRGHRVYFELGRGEMRQGRSLDALLSAYRIGARLAWRRFVDAGREAGVAARRALHARRVDLRLHRRAVGRVDRGLRRRAVGGGRRGRAAAPAARADGRRRPAARRRRARRRSRPSWAGSCRAAWPC